ncbi:hypothetical protein Zmor_013735 [Zophobas morio]|uniref:Uncharacterized protein n=1 Tax=Zophobas morio TaxID=2755281 RepID=A0AA38IG08_9CUCU|nr:hypothetical protein Zmor_013735 [Zophobas morio]
MKNLTFCRYTTFLMGYRTPGSYLKTTLCCDPNKKAGSKIVIFVTKVAKILLRNRPIHRPDTTPMGFLICAAMMADSLSVAAAGRRSLKKNLEAEVAMGTEQAYKR